MSRKDIWFEIIFEVFTNNKSTDESFLQSTVVHHSMSSHADPLQIIAMKINHMHLQFAVGMCRWMQAHDTELLNYSTPTMSVQ